MSVQNHVNVREVEDSEALLDKDINFSKVEDILNGSNSDEGRNKKVFDYKNLSTGKEYKLKLVYGDFSFENMNVVNGLEQVPQTSLLYNDFEQKGITGKKGSVVIQEASDINYADILQEEGWEYTLRESVGMQEDAIEDSFEENGRRAILYDFRPSNIHFFENEDGGYESKFIDVSDTQAIQRPTNAFKFRKQLAAAYGFIINGKDDQRGLIQYAADNQVEVTAREAAELIANESRYINEEIFKYSEDVRSSFESSIKEEPDRFSNYSQ